MKWLKYRHKFSSGLGAWQWMVVDDDATEESVRDNDTLHDLTNEYSHSDKYGGIDYEIVDKAPRWVIIEKLGRAVERKEAAIREHAMYQKLVDEAEECRQCKNARVPTQKERFDHKIDKDPCPTCGLEVVVDSVPFWLMPDDVDAVKLLGSLVENGKRSVKSKKFRWPVEDKDEEEAYHRLGKLGLAGGSAYQNTYEIHATKHGEAEWQKHKERASDTCREI
jgi:hypothetical protein